MILPLHPRTRKALGKYAIAVPEKVRTIDPVGYLDMISLEANAKKIVTDSGGIQKEAYFTKVPCITLRENTEWIETVNVGANKLVGNSPQKIGLAIKEFENANRLCFRKNLYGSGDSVGHIQKLVKDFCN